MTISGAPDFWWLSESQASQSWLIGVGHHAPLTDDDEPSITHLNQEKPVIPGWFHSLDDSDKPITDFKWYPLNFLDRWRSACDNINVYRTMKLFPEQSDGEPIIGPFLVDIDNQDWTDGYSERLADTLCIARQAVDFCIGEWHLTESTGFRVFFSGRKGFNIEIRPECLEIDGPVSQQLQLSSERLDEIIAHLRNQNAMTARPSNVVSQQGTQVDRIYGSHPGYGLGHPYIRLHGSWNKWISGGTFQRTRLELSVDTLKNESIESICSQAENRSGSDNA